METVELGFAYVWERRRERRASPTLGIAGERAMPHFAAMAGRGAGSGPRGMGVVARALSEEGEQEG